MPLHAILAATLLSPVLAAVPSDGPVVLFEPEQPTTLDEVRVVLAGKAGCPHVGGLERDGRNVVIELATGCPLAPPLPPEDYHFEVDLGHLASGDHRVRVVGPGGALRFSGDLTVALAVEPIVFTPAAPNARDRVKVKVTLEGLDLCPLAHGAEVRGHTIDVDYDDTCLAPPPDRTPPQTASFEVSVGPLAATFYRVRVRDRSAGVVATADLVVQPADRCLTGDGSLCLRGGRFRARATFRKADGSRSAARPIAIGEDSGLFWFHDPDNAELVVKVLGACFPPYNRFWVYAAGLTDRETTLTVTDLRSGQSRTYHNRRGKSFAPVFDTRAFATCP